MNIEGEHKALEQSVEQAQNLLEQMDNIVKNLCKSESIQILKDASIEERVNSLQLILQYRMDSQDSLVRLMRIEQSLLQILGIERLGSDYLNLENLEYALGRDDFKLLLSDLNTLIDKLLKIIHKEQLHQKQFDSKDKPQKQPTKAKTIQQSIQKLSLMQRKLLSQLLHIQESLTLFLKQETIGPVHDHIVALQGPVSRFFQLILSGLKDSQELVAHLRPEKTISEKLEPILENANETLHQMAVQSLKSNYFAPKKEPMINQETLEARAEKKRLGHFFYRP